MRKCAFLCSFHSKHVLAGQPKCLSNVCLNGGTCLVDRGVQSFVCACLPEYTGTLCELRRLLVDVQCKTIECLNGEKHFQKTISCLFLPGGTCLPSSNGPPVCLCQDGFTGDKCELRGGSPFSQSDVCVGMRCPANTE